MANQTEKERSARTVALSVLSALTGGQYCREGAIEECGLASIVIDGEEIRVVNGRLQGRAERFEITQRRLTAERERKAAIRRKVEWLVSAAPPFERITLDGVTFEIRDGALTETEVE
jgi:hypothetical protein